MKSKLEQIDEIKNKLVEINPPRSLLIHKLAECIYEIREHPKIGLNEIVGYDYLLEKSILTKITSKSAKAAHKESTEIYKGMKIYFKLNYEEIFKGKANIHCAKILIKKFSKIEGCPKSDQHLARKIGNWKPNKK